MIASSDPNSETRTSTMPRDANTVSSRCRYEQPTRNTSIFTTPIGPADAPTGYRLDRDRVIP